MMPGCLNNKSIITRELEGGNTFITICAADFGGGMEVKMKKLIPFMTVFMAVIFLCHLCVLAAPNPEYCKDDYREKTIQDEYGNIIEKPTAQMMAIRERDGKILDSVPSYAGMDTNTEFPALTCYVGDTLRFEDLSSSDNGNIASWDWQYYGALGEHFNEYTYNVVNQTSIYLDQPGETTFFLCVKSDIKVKKGSCDPWSQNGNHQVTGRNKWFPQGMQWYFTAVRVVVKPTVEAKVYVRYWDAQNNTIFHEGTVWLGELKENEQVETSIHITDWEGYEFSGWHVVLPDNTVQYSGSERDVGVTLAHWLPEKYLNVEFYPVDPTPEEPTPPEIIPDKPSGICDGEITWTETDSHRVLTGHDRHGNPEYKTCKHTFTYKAVLEADATVSPAAFKSGYGFEVEVSCIIKTSLIKNEGDDSWGDNRTATSKVKNPTKATVYIPWVMKNRLGTQSQSITMDNYSDLKFKLPVSNVSESGARNIYTPVELAGTEDAPESHSFEIYINGGGVGNTEFCKKLSETITINGNMYDDDVSGAN